MNTFTEEEAILKWCPERAKVAGAEGPGGFDDYCIGSHCMWWQWINPPTEPRREGFCGAIWRFR